MDRKSVRYISVFMICIIILGLFAGCGDSGSQSGSKKKSSSRQLAVLKPFTTKDLEGNDVDQSIIDNTKLNVLYLWKSDDPTCKAHMREVIKTAEKFGDKVNFISVVFDGEVNKDSAKEVLKENKANFDYNILPASEILSIMDGGRSVPVTIVIGKDNKAVMYPYQGGYSSSYLDMILEEKMPGSE